jgi:hypothetical protein
MAVTCGWAGGYDETNIHLSIFSSKLAPKRPYEYLRKLGLIHIPMFVNYRYIIKKICNTIQQNPSTGANSLSASQEIPCH